MGPDFPVPERPIDGTWRATGEFTRLDVGLRRELAPGESLQGDYAILAPPSADLHAGEFHFGDTYHLDGFGNDRSAYLCVKFTVTLT